MASSSLAVAAIILLFLLAGPASVVHSYVGNPYASGLLQRPKSDSKYQNYIVLLRSRPGWDTMDDDARRRWHQSFLPSNLIDSGEPRLICSYKALFDSFAARLTVAELKEIVTDRPSLEQLTGGPGNGNGGSYRTLRTSTKRRHRRTE